MEAGFTDMDLEKQAHVMAESALSALPESVRAGKLEAVKEGILRRLRDQSMKSMAPETAWAAPSNDVPVQTAPPPAPPPVVTTTKDLPILLKMEGVELLGDEAWFADATVCAALRAAVAANHAEQKILVGAPADEIRRICPGEDRLLGAGAVLRLGGAHHGGYGESDIGYAYRQLSRALHPDKNPTIPEAQDAFKRLTDASDELRQLLTDTRNAIRTLCQAMGSGVSQEVLERPQVALLSEASRMLSAVLALGGEGTVPDVMLPRASAAFAASPCYYRYPGQALLGRWYDDAQLLDVFAGTPLRVAYDCSQKRYRAQFLCALNRAAMVESKRNDSCVRGTWQAVMQQFPEIGLWRDFLDKLRRRVWAQEDPGSRGDKWDDSSGPRVTSWAKRWRDVITNVLPSSSAELAPATDSEVRRLAAALWRDIAAWARKEGEAERHLQLFTSESTGQDSLADSTADEWAFVPATDMLLTVGDSLVGITAEGMFVEKSADQKRLTFAVALRHAKAGERGGAKRAGEDSERQVKQAKLNRSPTRVVLLTNLVGPGEADEDLKEETAEEAGRFGKLKSIVIKEVPGAPDNEAVRIFLEFAKNESAAKAYSHMNGRYFGGRVVKARFYDEERFAKGDLEKRVATRILLLTNLVGAGEVDDDLKEETAEEAGKHGDLKGCIIKELQDAPNDEAVRIFLEFSKPAEAAKAFSAFDGRFFGGRKVRARFYDEQRYANGELS